MSTKSRRSQRLLGHVSDLLLFRSGVRDLKVIGHREHARYLFGAHLSQVFVALTIDHTLQRNVSTLHKDVDRRHRLHGIREQSGSVEDGASNRNSYAIVSG